MQKIILYYIFLFMLCAVLIAQTAPDTLWTKTFGGFDSDYGESVIQTIDDGFLIAGSTNSFGAGSSDAWLIKTDENGVEEWNQTYGGIEYDYAESIIQLADGSYIIAGQTNSFDANNHDLWLFKIDENGNVIWNRLHGGSNTDRGFSVQQTSDGGFVIIGMTQSYGAGMADCWLVKTDSNGIEEWNQTYGGNNNDWAYSIQETSDGGYIISGDTSSIGAGYEDAWLIKTDNNGNEEWNQIYGGWNRDVAFSVKQTDDGGFVLAGETSSFGTGGNDCWLIKTNEYGIEE